MAMPRPITRKRLFYQPLDAGAIGQLAAYMCLYKTVIFMLNNNYYNKNIVVFSGMPICI